MLSIRFLRSALLVAASLSTAFAQSFANVPALSFTTVANGANPLPQVVTITSTGAQFVFSATPSTSTGGSWLTVTPSGGECCVTPEGLTVSVNAAALAAGTYTGQIVFANYPTGTITMTVPVSLIVASSGGTYFGDVAGQASFSMLPNGAPPSQIIQIENGGSGTLHWTVTATTADGGNWLDVPVTAGNAPSMVTVGITPASLPGGGATAGTFIGQLLFSATGSSVTVPVSVTVGSTVFTQVNPINFTMPQGGGALPQVLSISSPGTNFTFSSAVFTGVGGAWLSISNLGGECCNTPLAETVHVSASTLSPGTYIGEIVLTQYPQRDLAMTVPVTLTIAAPGTTFFDSLPGEMSFFRTTAETPAAQAVPIRNGGTGTLNWTASATTADGGHWLTLSAPGGTAPSTLTVSILTSALPNGGLNVGTFDGQVVLQTGADVVTIPVSVVVGPNVFGQVNPIAFTAPEGGAALPQVLAVANTGTNVTFSSAVYTANGGSWLTISNLGGECCNTPENITVSINASGLLAGVYSGEIVFQQYPQQDMALTVPVTLTIVTPGSTAFFDSLPGQMSFTLTPNGIAPAAQAIQIRNAGTGTLHWTLSTSTADGSNWLTASALSGTAPSTVSMSITPSALPGNGLAAGTFNGQIVLLSTTGDEVTIPVSVTVGANVFAQVNAINFTMPQGGGNPLPQILALASTGTNFTFSSAVSTTSGGAWLTISNLGGECCNTPEAITVSVSASTLPAGTYSGQITFVQYPQQNLAITVPVTLTIETPGSSFFDNMPGQLSFFMIPGATPTPQSVQVRNGGSGSFNWTVKGSTADGGAWLTVSPASGRTPATVTVSVVTNNLPGHGLTAATYNGQLVFTGASDVVTIPISVTVGANTFSQLNGISFVMPMGGANPLPQILPVVSTGTNFTYSSAVYTGTGGNWLSISNLGGECCNTPEAITASVNASTLPAGTYTGEITFAQYPQRDMLMTVPVTLTVVSCGSYFDNIQGQMSFSFVPSSSNPPSQTVQIRAAGSGALNWSLTTITSDGGAWLTKSAGSGTAPSSVTIGVRTASLPGGGLTAGTFTGQVIIKSSSGIVTIPVSVLVGANVFSQAAALNFSMTLGGSNPSPQIVAVDSTGTNFTFSASSSTGTGGAWLSISPKGFECCNTPANITATVTATTLPAGIYTGQITLAQYPQQSMAMTVPVILTISDPHVPARITATGGTPQSAKVTKAFATDLGATVKDSGGTPVSGVLVTFNAPTSGASGTFACSGNTAITNSAGVATAQTFTANTVAGRYTVTAVAAALTTNPGYVLTNKAGAPAAITATAGTPQSATINTAFAIQLGATVTDTYGNPVGNVTVTFNAPTSGASGTFAGGVNTATTNGQGVATAAVFTANSIAGAYSVTATVGTHTTTPGFALTNLAGPPTSIAATGGTPQSAKINTAFATNLQATVTDASGNPVPGVTVTFNAPTTGASGTFAGGVNTAITNSLGVATAAAFTANGTTGSYVVRAKTGTLTTVPGFALTNTAN